MANGIGAIAGSVGQIAGAANPLGVITAGVGAVAGLAQGLIGGRKRRREERQALAEFRQAKSRFEAIDTSNPYKNLTNTFEDLTVNTQAAEFAAQQADQSRANILGSLSASAGGGGIAALAQSLANQQTQAAQQAAASIGQQERQNQVLSAQQEGKVQQLQAAGERQSQELEFRKQGALLQMSAGRLQQARQARQQATQAAIGGLAGAAGLAGGAALVGKGDIGQGFKNLMGLPSSPILPPPKKVLEIDPEIKRRIPTFADAFNNLQARQQATQTNYGENIVTEF
jgi:hypothetical protein